MSSERKEHGLEFHVDWFGLRYSLGFVHYGSAGHQNFLSFGGVYVFTTGIVQDVALWRLFWKP